MITTDREEPCEEWRAGQHMEARRFWAWALTAAVSIGAGILIGAVLFW